MLPVVHGEKETTNQRRARLAQEFRFITHQYNSKLLELLDEGLDVDVEHRDGVSCGENALVRAVEVSYQTPRKFYRG